MDKLSPLLMITGLVLIALALVTGEAKVALVLFIPVIYGGGILLLLGILLLFLGIFARFFLPMTHEETTLEKNYGGVVFIGPIPMVFGSDAKITRTMMYIGLVIAIILLLFYVLWLL